MEELSEAVKVPAKDQQNVFGQFDSHMKKLERQFGVAIVDRNGEMTISGSSSGVKKAKAIITELTELSKIGRASCRERV